MRAARPVAATVLDLLPGTRRPRRSRTQPWTASAGAASARTSRRGCGRWLEGCRAAGACAGELKGGTRGRPGPRPTAGLRGGCPVGAGNPQHRVDEVRGVLRGGSAEVKADACPADGRFLGTADVHLLPQRAEQCERMPGDPETAFDEVVYDLL